MTCTPNIKHPLNTRILKTKDMPSYIRSCYVHAQILSCLGHFNKMLQQLVLNASIDDRLQLGTCRGPLKPAPKTHRSTRSLASWQLLVFPSRSSFPRVCLVRYAQKKCARIHTRSAHRRRSKFMNAMRENDACLSVSDSRVMQQTLLRYCTGVDEFVLSESYCPLSGTQQSMSPIISR